MRLVFAISCFRKGSRRINLFLKAKEYQVVFFFFDLTTDKRNYFHAASFFKELKIDFSCHLPKTPCRVP